MSRRQCLRSVIVAMVSVFVLALQVAPVLASSRPLRPVFAGQLLGWRLAASNPTASVGFQQGPYTPPFGGGSLSLRVGNGSTGGTGIAEAVRDGGGGLESLLVLTYWTHVSANDGTHWPEVALDIDQNGNGSIDDQLVFQPSYQTPTTGSAACPDQGAAAMDQWQGWNAEAGCWWNTDKTVGTPGNGVVRLDDYLSAFPGSVVRRIHVRTGLGTETDRFEGNVDGLALHIGGKPTAVYDFNHFKSTSIRRQWAGPGTAVIGPATPPLGPRSRSMNVGNGTTGGNRFLNATKALSDAGCGPAGDQPCHLLSRLAHVSYWTYVSQSDGVHWPMMVFAVDHNQDGVIDDQLFFQPAFQQPATGNVACPDQGPVRLNAWQGWTPSDGCWWNANGDFGSPGHGVRPLAEYVVAHPNARVISMSIRVGGGTPGDIFRTYVDAAHVLWQTPDWGERFFADFG
jgi:hypothetical protein